jgi:hypothetical protein
MIRDGGRGDEGNEIKTGRKSSYKGKFILKRLSHQIKSA